jgi:glyoxylase I family protein
MIAVMPALGLNHYNLRAARELMETLRAFYVEVVGLEPGPRPPFASVGHWLYAGGRPVLHLSLASPAEGRSTGARTTFDHVAFDCAGRAAYEALLAARGIAFEVARVPGTTQVQVFFDDPAGNGVELDFPRDDA